MTAYGSWQGVKSLAELAEQAAQANVLRAEVEALRGELEAYQTLHTLEDWHEDYGDALWWTLPIEEPPYCGSPLCSDWPGYHTHWTRIVEPKVRKEDTNESK